MTFYEAAIEVLMAAERPLHYKKITEIAIQKKLLSHIGKTPEVTMGARLIQEIKKHDGPSAQIVRTRPGVYALRSWDDKPSSEASEAAPSEKAAADETKSTEKSTVAPPEKAANDTPEEGRGRRRRRRRRRGEDSGEESAPKQTEASAPVEAQEETPSEKAPEPPKAVKAKDGDAAPPDVAQGEKETSAATEEAPKPVASGGGDSPREDGRGARSGRRGRNRGRGRRGRREEDSDREGSGGFTSRSKSTGESRDRDSRQPSSKPSTQRTSNGKAAKSQVAAKESAAAAADERPVVVKTHLRFEVSGVSIRAEKLCEVSLELLQRAGQPIAHAELVAPIAERYSMPPVLDKLEGMLTVALVADNEVRRAEGRRQLFQRMDGAWALTAWGLDAKSLKLESELYRLSAELQSRTLSLLSERIGELTFDACQQLLMTLLKQQGYVPLATRKRCSDGDLVLSTEHRRGLSTERVAIRLSVNKELKAEAVTELRGTLHHYNASRGVVVTTGDVSSEALQESSIENLAPITLIDRAELARMLHNSGIGTQRFEVSVPFVNQAFFAALS